MTVECGFDLQEDGSVSAVLQLVSVPAQERVWEERGSEVEVVLLVVGQKEWQVAQVVEVQRSVVDAPEEETPHQAAVLEVAGASGTSKAEVSCLADREGRVRAEVEVPPRHRGEEVRLAPLVVGVVLVLAVMNELEVG